MIFDGTNSFIFSDILLSRYMLESILQIQDIPETNILANGYFSPAFQYANNYK